MLPESFLTIMVCVCAVTCFVPIPRCQWLHQTQDLFADRFHGVISVPSPAPGMGLQLSIVMRQKAALPENYVGHLQTLDSKETIMRKIYRQKPIQYQVSFPLGYAIPKFSWITYNNRTFCIGEGYRDKDAAFKKIVLKHDLEWIGIGSPSLESTPIAAASTTETPATTTVTGPPSPSALHSSRPDVQSEENRNACGHLDAKYKVVKRMLGGQEVASGHWPWMAAIHTYNDGNLIYRCGGTLISSKIVVTAAHCLTRRGIGPYRKDDIIVSLGQISIHKLHDNSTFSTGISSVNLHPDFPLNFNNFYDADIAVIILEKLAPLSDLIKPACLWSGAPDETLIVGKTGVVVGWGKDESGHLVTSAPRKTIVPIVSHKDCSQSNTVLAETISSRTLCAGNRSGVGPCSGDSGGGLIMYENGTWQLRGIISVSILNNITKKCDLNEFIVYTDVAHFTDWIQTFR